MKKTINTEQSVTPQTKLITDNYVERWYQRSWRPMMAAIYMFLSVLDYGIRPIINYYQGKSFDLAYVVQTIESLEPIVQIEVINASKRDLVPPILTEYVHLAFGAILGVAAFSRGSTKGFMEGSNIPTTNRTNRVIIDRRRREVIDNPDNEEADG